MDKTLNPLDWEMDLLWDTKSSIVRKLNPLNWRLEMVYSADSYIQKVNPFTWDFDLVSWEAPSYIEKVVTGNGYVNLTNAIANQLLEFKAYGWTEQRNLPEGYTQYEYLRSNGTQYIDLGYKGNWNTKVEVKFKYHTTTSATGSGRIFGSRTSSSSNAFAIGTSSGIVSATNNKVFWCYDWQSFYVVDDIQFGLDEWKTIIFSATEHKVDGTTYGDDYNITEFETPSNLMLFAFDNGGTIGVGYIDIAYCKLWNNWVLVRDLIPCKNGSNVIGMYDKVSETLLTNAGTGTFETWNTATPTPEKPMNIVSNNWVLKFSKNMANVNTQTILLWYYISSSWVVTADANNRIYQEYIPCKPNTTYTLSFSSEVYYVTISEYSTTDDSGFIIRNAGTSWWNTQLTITTSATTNYVRFWTNIDRTEITLEEVLAINWQLEQWDTPTPYKPYAEWWVYVDWTAETIWVQGKNLFNKSDIIIGKILNDTGEEISQSSWYYSWHISVNASTEYTISQTGGEEIYLRVLEYDSTDTMVKLNKGATVGTQTKTFTTGATTTYVIVSGGSKNNALDTIQLELGSTATTYEAYFNGWTATAEILLAIWDTKDVQEIISWSVTRNLWIKVLDWTEDRASTSSWTGYKIYSLPMTDCWTITDWSSRTGYCTHFDNYIGDTNPNYSTAPMYSYWQNATGAYLRFKVDDTNFANLTAFTNWLKAQCLAWTPVIVIYPLATATTESVTGQTMDIQAWSNTIEITQASIDNLWLYAKYKATA